MLNFADRGRPLAKIVGGVDKGRVLYIDPTYIDESKKIKYGKNDLGVEYESDGRLDPVLNVFERTVTYITGPCGAGKTTFSINLVKGYKKVYPEYDFYLFSRTDYKSDPAYKGIGKVYQITIDESLLENPIDIETEIPYGSIILFDDITTIQNEKLKKYVEKLLIDELEVGRKLFHQLIICNHLLIPQDKRLGRVILNEMQSVTVFNAKSSVQPISYALKTYYGLDKEQIKRIIGLNSRWISVYKNHPPIVMWEKGAYII